MTKDLIILVADGNMKNAINGLLERTASLGISSISWDTFVHLHHDPGCYLRSHHFLSSFINQYDRCLVVFDREGCGQEQFTREQLEEQVETNLNNSGWVARSASVVIDPELEAWVWTRSHHVDIALGWENQEIPIRDWLRQQNFIENAGCLLRPKEAMEAVLRAVRKPRSSSIYQQLARNVSLRGCSDPAFNKFRDILQNWFPE